MFWLFVVIHPTSHVAATTRNKLSFINYLSSNITRFHSYFQRYHELLYGVAV